MQNGGLEIVDGAEKTIDTWNQSDIAVSDDIPTLSLDCSVWVRHTHFVSSMSENSSISDNESFDINMLQIIFVVERKY